MGPNQIITLIRFRQKKLGPVLNSVPQVSASDAVPVEPGPIANEAIGGAEGITMDTSSNGAIGAIKSINMGLGVMPLQAPRHLSNQKSESGFKSRLLTFGGEFVSCATRQ